MISTKVRERVETLHACQSRTKSSLRSLQPVMGTSTLHVHGGWDPGTCLVLEEGGDPDLVPVLAMLITCFATLTKTFVSS